jgi:hypothetical protein
MRGCGIAASQAHGPSHTNWKGGLVTCKVSHEKTYRVIGGIFLPDRPAEYYISERL